MNRLERLTGILLLLQARPRTSDEIARHFEVSKRTVLRDVQALSEMGVPVIAREGVGGGYSLPDDFKLAPMPFTTHEAFLLLFALQALDGLSGMPFSAARATLAAKLRAALPAIPHDEARHLLGAITGPRRPPQKAAPFLEPLLQAVNARTWVRLTYRSVRRTSTQIVFPHRITSEDGLWLLEAFSREHEEYRRYRVDRIEALEPLPDWQEAPPVPIPYDHADHPVIQALVTARGVALLDGQPDLAEHVVVQADGSGRLELRCPPSELDYFARLLATLGNEVEVHEPPALRERLLDLGQILATRYGKR
jgi:predicted DNA-binding transcriptional regulator YafY